jgi:hypothetical protein
MHQKGALIEILVDLMKDKQVVFFNIWSYFRLTDEVLSKYYSVLVKIRFFLVLPLGPIILNIESNI